MPSPRLRFLEHRVPPLLVALAIAAFMRAATEAAPDMRVDWALTPMLGWSLVALGAGVVMAGVWAFRRHQTTMNPLFPFAASTLVGSGIYRRTRNPMYLGVSIALFGYSALLAHPLSALLAGLFPAYVARFQIEPEERALDQLFGEAYVRYKNQVPRWL